MKRVTFSRQKSHPSSLMILAAWTESRYRSLEAEVYILAVTTRPIIGATLLPMLGIKNKILYLKSVIVAPSVTSSTAAPSCRTVGAVAALVVQFPVLIVSLAPNDGLWKVRSKYFHHRKAPNKRDYGHPDRQKNETNDLWGLIEEQFDLQGTV